MKDINNKKIKWLRLASELVFITGGILSAIMVTLLSFEVSLGAYKEKDNVKPVDVVKDFVNSHIADDYCAMMLEEYLENDWDEKTFEKYEKLNMDFMIVETKGNNNYDENGRQIYKTNRYTDYSGTFHGYGIGGYVYNADSLYSALYTDAYAHNGHTSDTHKVNLWVLYKVKEVPTSEALATFGYKPDFFFQAFQMLYRYRFVINHAFGLTFIIVFITVIAFMTSSLLGVKKDGEGGIRLLLTDRIPFSVITLIYAVGVYACIDLLGDVFDYVIIRYFGISTSAIFIVGILVIAELMTLMYAKSLVVRIRSKKFWKYTLIYRISKYVKYLYDKAEGNIPELLKAVIVVGAVSLIELLTVALISGLSYEGRGYEFAYMLFFLLKVVELVAVILPVLKFVQVVKGTELIAEGNIDSKINISKLRGSLRRHAQNINELGNVTKNAVDERLKSEHLKTELITNVSHDIKTPLTSIINYVDLIKRENEENPIKNEKVREYITVLDRQSVRLKKLINDLIDASKASTGNMEVNMEACDLGVLLSQTIGEFADKAQMNHVEPVMRVREEDNIRVMADGRLLWRVFGNIMENACKYSLPGTRVYMETENQQKEQNMTEPEYVCLVFKNISKEPLDISSDELMERFVRGDSSRNTEGSGLGLSIASSLMELMQGKMKITIDGDMFKVMLWLKVADCTDTKTPDATTDY